jgi:hypothetical protein
MLYFLRKRAYFKGSLELNVYSVVNPIDMYIKANKIEGDTTFLTSLFEKLHERLATYAIHVPVVAKCIGV